MGSNTRSIEYNLSELFFPEQQPAIEPMVISNNSVLYCAFMFFVHYIVTRKGEITTPSKFAAICRAKFQLGVDASVR